MTTTTSNPSFRVLVKGQPVDFTSAFVELADAMDYLDKNCTKVGQFGTDLLRVWMSGKSLTSGQVPWAHKIATDLKTRLEAPPADTTGISPMKSIQDLFTTACKNLKRPAITLEVDGLPVQLKLAAPTSANAGFVYVTNGASFGTNLYYGKISPTGEFQPGRAFVHGLVDTLNKLAADPAKLAAEHGHKTGRCCFCNRQLDDERSTDVGYGPVCAKNYALPWG